MLRNAQCMCCAKQQWWMIAGVGILHAKGDHVSTAKRTSGRSKRRGAVMVEYSLLLALVGMPAVAGMYAGGKAMVQSYLAVRNSVLSTTP